MRFLQSSVRAVIPHQPLPQGALYKKEHQAVPVHQYSSLNLNHLIQSLLRTSYLPVLHTLPSVGASILDPFSIND